MRIILLCIIATAIVFACTKDNKLKGHETSTGAMYFPPVASNQWETTNAAALNWNETELNNLYTYLQQKNTKAFIILHKGRIVAEKYFGTFTADSSWYWASAGKTVTGLLVGIAQQEGLLSINDRTSKYLGEGWTSMPLNKENLITVRHQLTMTSGLNDVGDVDCTLPSCLQYKGDAGTRWAYHNAPYTLLEKVIEAASGKKYNNYFQQKIRDRIGMDGLWVRVGYNNVYFSTPRSMARFGLLLLNKGTWSATTILADTAYQTAQVNTSQNYNLSYGYLTWLNGKNSYMLPTLQHKFNGSIIPNAPTDMFAALGKNDQKLYVVPSLNVVVIRMGEDSGNSNLALSSFDNELWGKLKLVMKF